VEDLLIANAVPTEMNGMRANTAGSDSLLTMNPTVAHVSR
jgi:hypothetical protein